jgi:hypothetical protein
MSSGNSRKGAGASRRAAAISIFGATALALGLAMPARSQTPTPVVNSPTVPPDVSIPHGFPGNPIAFFDDYSWRVFIALVWPGEKDQRGQPDHAKTVSDAGPRVFETYKALHEIFHKDGTKSADWNAFDPPKYNPCDVQEKWGDVTLGSFSKFSNLGQAGFGDLVGPLVAQNHTYVRFLTAYNKIEFDKIVANEWYLRSHLPSAGITFDKGSIDVKSSWVEMQDVADPSRFYTRPATVLDPVTGASKSIEVGLVGLHIVQKTPSRPQWIWTTFEQLDNVPPARPAAKGKLTFHDGTAKPMPAADPYPTSRVLSPPTAPPFNVVRVKTIHKSTEATNTAYHAALPKDSVWRNYQLVMTQWPTTPNSPALPGTPGQTFPGAAPNDVTAFSNVTLETFDQNNIRTGCMNCHNFTKTATDFLWSLNDHAFPASSATPDILMRNDAFRELRSLILKQNED